MISILPVLWGCKEQSDREESAVSASLTINMPASKSDDTPLANALGVFEDIDQVTVDVKQGEIYLINGQTLTKSNNLYSGVLEGLPKNEILTFIGHAYNDSAIEIYSNSLFPVSQTLTGSGDTISLSLVSIDDGQSLELPQVTKIEHVSTVERGKSIPLRIWMSSTNDETMTYYLSGNGFSFYPATGSASTANLSGVFISTASALTSVGAGDYTLIVKLVNEQGNFVETPFSITIQNLYKLPDTGQTGDITATFGEDSDYLINPPSYIDNGDGTVSDVATGLDWQQQDDDLQRTQLQAVDYCTNLSLGGYDDWRLPGVMELKDIIDYTDINPALDPSTFVNADHANYWSSTLFPNNSNRAMRINFGTGVQGNGKKDDVTALSFSRCVRGLSVIYGNLQDNTDGTITDQDTNLTWQQSEGGTNDWDSALNYCENLSLGTHSDWRLPNAKELQSILDYRIIGNGNPKLNPTFFPSAKASFYWSSTTYRTGSKAWRIQFNTAAISKRGKGTVYDTRCVRTTN